MTGFIYFIEAVGSRPERREVEERMWRREVAA